MDLIFGSMIWQPRPADWGVFISAYILFVLSHVIPTRPAVRRWIVSQLGERGFLIAYSILSLIIFALLIKASDWVLYDQLWSYARWQTWVPALVMPFVCILIAFGVGAGNPLSFASRNAAAFDPEHPGIAGAARHPILWAIALWSAAHLVPNGDLAKVVLFGGFVLFAIIGMVIYDRKMQRLLGKDEWTRLAANTSFWPLTALLTGRWRPAPTQIDQKRLALAVLIYVLFILFHAPIIGMSPLPIF